MDGETTDIVEDPNGWQQPARGIPPPQTIMSTRVEAPPKRWVQLKKALEENDWILDRISGSHHIFTKRGARCIPVAVHGGTLSPQYTNRVLCQAGLIAREDDDHGAQEIHPSGADSLIFHTATADGIPKLARAKKQIQSPKRPTKSEREQQAIEKRQGEMLHEQLEKLELQKKQEQHEAESERMELLEQTQAFIAAGDFEAAIDSTSFILSENDFGSSCDFWQFKCDILFYRTVALSEHALSSSSFNSTNERAEIEEALGLLQKFMESSSERREEARAFATNLQNRIIGKYVDGLFELFRRYSFIDSKVRSQGEPDDVQQRMMIGLFPELSEVEASPEEGNKLTNELVDAFQFILSVAHGKQISFVRALGKNRLSEIAPLVSVCLRKMLISFDRGHYDDVSRLSSTIESIASEQIDYFRVMNLTLAPFVPHHSLLSPELLKGIATHIGALIPVYKLANQKLHWNRFAGVIAEGIIPSETKGQLRDFDSILEFLDALVHAMKATRTLLPLLVLNNQTRRFIFDTFSDAVLLAKHASELMMFADAHVSGRILTVLKEFARKRKNDPSSDIDELVLSKPEFRKGRYDKLRAHTVRLCLSILWISNLYDELLKVNVSVREKTISQNLIFVTSRYKDLPDVLSKLGMLLKFGFGPDNVTIALLHQAIVTSNDLDLAENFFVGLDDGTIVGQTASAGRKKTPEETRAAGIWSLCLSFNIYMQLFLQRFANEKELTRLRVIDQISNRPIQMNSKCYRIEYLAFDLLVKFDAVAGRFPNNTVVENLLCSILCDPVNHGWCDILPTEAKRKRWAKNKSQRFSRLINRLGQGLSGIDMSATLCQRDVSVQFLLDQLQTCVQCARKVPQNMRDAIVKSPTDENLVQACVQLKDWTHEELHLVRQNIFALEEAAEQATGYFSTATGHAFPHILATTSPQWTMARHATIVNETYSVESVNVIRDLKYVSAILSAISNGY